MKAVNKKHTSYFTTSKSQNILFFMSKNFLFKIDSFDSREISHDFNKISNLMERKKLEDL